jgi:hypothetical protein
VRCASSEASRSQLVTETSYNWSETSPSANLSTPYINGEVFYDTRYGAWSQNRYSAGVQVPAGARIVLETYFLRQNQSYSTSLHVNVIGIKFRFYF